jgi:hypothetical protein
MKIEKFTTEKVFNPVDFAQPLVTVTIDSGTLTVSTLVDSENNQWQAQKVITFNDSPGSLEAGGVIYVNGPVKFTPDGGCGYSLTRLV